MSRHPVRSAALLYALLSMLLLAPGLMPGKTISTADSLYFSAPWLASRPATLHRPANNELGDAVVQFQPFAAYAKQQLPTAPLWNPYLMGGRPLLADDQSAVFSPFTVPAYVTGVLTSLGWSAALKLFVAAFGTFLLARALRMRDGSALLAGLVYGFNFWLITWLAYPHSGVWAVFPWLLWATELVVRRPDPLSTGTLALAVGAQFLGGHAESSFDILVATAAFFVLRAVPAWRSARDRRRYGWRALAGFCLGVGGGTALAALVLAPFVELLLGSADLHQRAGTAIDEHLATRGLLNVFLPDYWGRATQTPLSPFIRAQAYYAGALPLLLALVALRVRPSVERVAIAVFGFTGLAVAVGIPPFLQIVTRLPIFSTGHNSRLIPWYMIALALLAAWGLDDLRSGRLESERPRRLALLLGIPLLIPVVFVLARDEIHHISAHAVLVATGAVHPPADPSPTTASMIHLASLLAWFAFGGAAAALIVLAARGRLRGTTLIAVAAGLIVLDLFRAGMGYNPAVAQADARQPATGAIRYLEAHRDTRYEATQDIAWNVIAMRYHLQEAGGYDIPIPSRFDRLWRREVDPEHPSQVGTTFTDIPLILPKVDERRLRTLRLLGVGNLLVAPNVPPLHLPGVHQVYSGADARVYSVGGAQPRAVVVSAQQSVPSAAEALNAVTSPQFTPRTVAVTEHPIAGLSQVGGGAGLGSARPAGQALVTSYAPEQVRVRVNAQQPGLLVLDEAYAPGWEATVDGRPVPVSRVDYVLRGVPVPAGTHTVTFHYSPLSWRIGRAVSLVSLVAIVAALLVGWRRRRAGERRVSFAP